MDEIKFVLKCFLFATLLLVLTQIKSGEKTIEGHIQAALINSEVANFVNKVVDGGVKMIRDGGSLAKESYLKLRYTDTSSSSEAVNVKNENTKKTSAEVSAELTDQE